MIPTDLSRRYELKVWVLIVSLLSSWYAPILVKILGVIFLAYFWSQSISVFNLWMKCILLTIFYFLGFSLHELMGEGRGVEGGVEVDDTLTSHKIINTVFWGSVS